jgi:hypothetical protein
VLSAYQSNSRILAPAFAAFLIIAKVFFNSAEKRVGSLTRAAVIRVMLSVRAHLDDWTITIIAQGVFSYARLV